MALYSAVLGTANTSQLLERHIYGASRLGMLLPADAPSITVDAGVVPFYTDVRQYEITNYLGNVNAVITDRKTPAGEEVLYSNDFSSVNDWAVSGTTTSGIVTNKLKVNIGGQWQNINKTFTTVPGQAYRITYTIDPNAQGNLNLVARDVATSTNLKVHSTSVVGTFTMEFIATGTTTRVDVESSVLGARIFYLDQIKIERTGTAIQYDNFTSVNNWTATGSSTATLSSGTLKATIAAQLQRVERTAVTIPGHTYRLFYHMNLNAQGNVNVVARDAAGTTLNLAVISSNTPAASWPYIEFQATGISTRIAFESVPVGARIFYVDNVSLVDIEYSGIYEAVVKMKADYYPFGMVMPGRHVDDNSYRYGYNGMERDNDVKGDGNSYTTEFRQYDPRLGRWLSLDPLMQKYPNMSPYNAFNNNPVLIVDPTGLEGEDWVKGANGKIFWDSRVTDQGSASTLHAGSTYIGKTGVFNVGDSEEFTLHPDQTCTYKGKNYPVDDYAASVTGPKSEPITLAPRKVESMPIQSDDQMSGTLLENADFSRAADGFTLTNAEQISFDENLRTPWQRTMYKATDYAPILLPALVASPFAIYGTVVAAPTVGGLGLRGLSLGWSGVKLYHNTFGKKGGYLNLLTNYGTQTISTGSANPMDHNVLEYGASAVSGEFGVKTQVIIGAGGGLINYTPSENRIKHMFNQNIGITLGNTINGATSPLYQLAGPMAGYIMGNAQQAAVGKAMNNLESQFDKLDK